ncbi:MAG: hypothetical protein HFH36_12030 [Lachnospiraceae bacterium]|nr:hypothetical protein [Lachnospiraceae bacterium]
MQKKILQRGIVCGITAGWDKCSRHDRWETTNTNTAAVEETSLTIQIEMNLAAGGWFWMDNVVLNKITFDASDVDAKKAELNTIMQTCKALSKTDYQAESWEVLQAELM